MYKYEKKIASVYEAENKLTKIMYESFYILVKVILSISPRLL